MKSIIKSQHKHYHLYFQSQTIYYNESMKGFIIAGTNSGAGKTTITLGIMLYLKKLGYKVQGFKAGPDFIDPGHHSIILNRPSHNLDSWMLKPWMNKAIFDYFSKDAEISIIEGVMGLYDGFSPIEDIGSTAHLAKVLNLPVVLVVNASSLARSVSAMILGYISFDKGVKIAGVILNNVGSKNHAKLLESSISHYLKIPCFGFFEKNPEISLPSRHLGLVTAYEDIWDEKKIEQLVKWTSKSITNDFLKFIEVQKKEKQKIKNPPLKKHVKIAVAKDEAFCFYYDINIKLLEQMGAEIIYFSPLKDTKLPKGIKGIYIGGGYPELYLEKLSQNTEIKKEILRFVEDNNVVYAECGGFMYLMNSIKNSNNRIREMVGVFPFNAILNKKLVSLGYRKIKLLENCPLGPKGIEARGHEFHYSFAQGLKEYPKNIYEVCSRDNEKKESYGVRYKNCIGSYIHLHFASNILIAKYFIKSCKEV